MFLWNIAIILVSILIVQGQTCNRTDSVVQICRESNQRGTVIYLETDLSSTESYTSCMCTVNIIDEFENATANVTIESLQEWSSCYYQLNIENIDIQTSLGCNSSNESLWIPSISSANVTTITLNKDAKNSPSETEECNQISLSSESTDTLIEVNCTEGIKPIPPPILTPAPPQQKSGLSGTDLSVIIGVCVGIGLILLVALCMICRSKKKTSTDEEKDVLKDNHANMHSNTGAIVATTTEHKERNKESFSSQFQSEENKVESAMDDITHSESENQVTQETSLSTFKAPNPTLLNEEDSSDLSNLQGTSTSDFYKTNGETHTVPEHTIDTEVINSPGFDHNQADNDQRFEGSLLAHNEPDQEINDPQVDDTARDNELQNPSVAEDNFIPSVPEELDHEFTVNDNHEFTVNDNNEFTVNDNNEFTVNDNVISNESHYVNQQFDKDHDANVEPLQSIDNVNDVEIPEYQNTDVDNQTTSNIADAEDNIYENDKNENEYTNFPVVNDDNSTEHEPYYTNHYDPTTNNTTDSLTIDRLASPSTNVAAEDTRSNIYENTPIQEPQSTANIEDGSGIPDYMRPLNINDIVIT